MTIEGPKINDLVLAAKAADWYKLKALVLSSVSSPITRRVYNMTLDEFIVWFRAGAAAGLQQSDGERLARVHRVRRAAGSEIEHQLKQRRPAGHTCGVWGKDGTDRGLDDSLPSPQSRHDNP